MSGATVALRFTGSAVVRRVIDEHEWTPDNGHVCDVPVELAARLLNSRESKEWELAGKPKPAVLRQLGELMGLAPAELMIVVGETAENGEVANEVSNG